MRRDALRRGRIEIPCVRGIDAVDRSRPRRRRVDAAAWTCQRRRRCEFRAAVRGRHCESSVPRNVPSRHGVHADDPTGAEYPAAHGSQVSPVFGWPPGENVFGGHC